MSEAVVVALITGVFALIGSVIGSFATKNKVVDDIKTEVTKNQAVTDVKIDELTREVREHNNFAKRMPVVEEQIKVINHRISDLEKK
jgi:hypothetical protein